MAERADGAAIVDECIVAGDSAARAPTMLTTAIRVGAPNIVKCLISRGVAVDADDVLANGPAEWRSFVLRGNWCADAVDQVIAMVPALGPLAIHAAVAACVPTTVLRLLQSGVQVDVEKLLSHDAEDWLRFVLAGEQCEEAMQTVVHAAPVLGSIALIAAIDKIEPAIVLSLLDGGVSIDQEKLTKGEAGQWLSFVFSRKETEQATSRVIRNVPVLGAVALTAAIERKDPAVVCELLRSNALVDQNRILAKGAADWREFVRQSASCPETARAVNRMIQQTTTANNGTSALGSLALTTSVAELDPRSVLRLIDDGALIDDDGMEWLGFGFGLGLADENNGDCWHAFVVGAVDGEEATERLVSVAPALGPSALMSGAS
jgi:hypothetical protein